MSVPYVGAYEHQCRGKRTYANSHAAKKAGKQAQTTNGGGRLLTYRCNWCGYYHLGHRPYQLRKKKSA